MKRITALLSAAVLTCLLFAGVPAAGEANLFGMMDTTDIDFKAFDASVFKRRTTLLSLWASWCGVYVEKIQDLETIRKEYAGRVNVVGVLLNAVTRDGKSINVDALEIARKILKERGASYPNIIATPELYALMNGIGVTIVPVTLLISPGGSILHMTAGALDAEGYRVILDSLQAGR